MPRNYNDNNRYGSAKRDQTSSAPNQHSNQQARNPASEGRGRGSRGFRKYGRPIQKDTPTRQPPPRAIKQQPHNPTPDLRPMHLSTTFTAPKNDPLFEQQCDKVAFPTLDPQPRQLEFKVDCAGFQTLIDQSYYFICDQNHEFRNSVSHASYAYYCIVGLWYRFYCIRSGQGIEVDDFISVTRYLDNSLPLHRPINQYLSCIGDFQDANQLFWRLEVPDLNDAGHFGNMDNDNVADYLCYPTPFIAISSIRQEVAAFNNHALLDQPWGNVDVNPDESEILSRNCPGYLLPNLISNDCFEKLDNLEILEPVNINVNGLLIQRDLINLVKRELLRVRTTPIDTVFPTSKSGSILQMAVTEFTSPFDLEHIETSCLLDKSVVTHSSHQLTSELACTSLLFKLRIRREQRLDGYPAVFEEAPDWDLNANFNTEDIVRWNALDFTIGSVNNRDVTKQFIDKFKT